MKIIKTYYRHFSTLFLFLAFVGCDDALDEKTFTTLSPNDFLTNGEDAEVLLNSVYGVLRYSDITRDAITLNEVNTDIHIERNGGIFASNELMEEFIWTPSHDYLQSSWERRYSIIFNANVVLDNVPDVDMDESRKQEILAEARFLRALSYYFLYDFFGPVPLVVSSETAVTDRPERASEEEIVAFIESELKAVSEILPVTPPRNEYGRPTSGSALGILAKFYMMTKKWEEAADACLVVMNLGEYDLFVDGNRTELFSPDNQRDNEFIFVSVMSDTPNDNTGNGWLSHVVPRDYQWEYPPRAIFAAEFKIRSEFLESFELEDQRLDAFLVDYVNADGEAIVLGEDDARSLKFPEYPNQDISRASDDFPFLRYADILLSRAEALNEINGPNQESIDLLNMVRAAAGVSTFVISDFPSKEAYKDFVLEERGREFHTEGLRRQDLIRHGRFIESALERGKAAKGFQVRFPIPQTEVERNQSLIQNEGY